MSAERAWDRRGTNRGDARRAALLGALDELLVGDTALDAITVAQLTKKAGVTRSGPAACRRMPPFG